MSGNKRFELKKFGAPKEAFRLIETPFAALTEDSLRIKIEAFGLNFADIMARQGKYREAPPLPFVPGYEIVGVVQEVGAQCSSNWLGKRVAGFCRFGGYSNEATVHPSSIVEVGDCDAGDALSLCTQGVTAAYMTDHIPQSSEGGMALVHSAAGGVGNLLVQMLKRKGIKTIGKIREAHKIKQLERLGVDHILVSDNIKYPEKVKEITGNKGLIAAFNPIGGSTVKADLNNLSSGGQLFLYGGASLLDGRNGIFSLLHFVIKSGFFSPIPLMMGSKSLVGVNVLKLADANPSAIQRYLSQCFHLYAKQELKPLEPKAFSSKDFHAAQAWLESGQSTGKVYVYWEDF